MTGQARIPHLLCDDVLGAAETGRILDFIAANQDHFHPESVLANGVPEFSDDYRPNTRRLADLAPVRDAVNAAVEARLPDIYRATGVPVPRARAGNEFQLAWVGDGGRFVRHADTFYGINAKGPSAPGYQRLVTICYYLSRQPARFTGGELRLYPLLPGGDGEQWLAVDPRHDRMIAFSSITPHEVMPVAVSGDDFMDGRFVFTIRITTPTPGA